MKYNKINTHISINFTKLSLSILTVIFSLLLYNLKARSVQAQTDICTEPFYSVATPLTDMGLNYYERLTTVNPTTYTPTNYQGGLYPNGQNERPAAHEAAGVSIANTIEPLDADGNPDPNGKIGMGSIGMSNTSGEFETFMGLYANRVTQNEVNDSLKVVNTAAPGAVMDFWIDPSLAQYSIIWDGWVYPRIAQRNLTPEQMQVFWVKVTDTDSNNFTFPEGAETLTDKYVMLMHEIQNRFPNVKLVYFSSRTRSYLNFQGLSPEPVAFENGFGVKWLIERQLNGDAELNYDANLGPVTSPYISWGPYLWIDGENPRSDGMQWFGTDLRSDCVHPSPSGNTKVAQMLWNYFRTDPTTYSWFLDPDAPPPANSAPTVNVGADVTLHLSDILNMNAAVYDDGLPTGSTLSVEWTVISGPGNVTMSDWYNESTDITFDTLGDYVLTLTADDTELTGSDSLAVSVIPDPVNQAPVVDVGQNVTMYLSDVLNMAATVTDDGLPIGATLAYQWSINSAPNPNTVIMTDWNSPTTDITFTEPGTYELALVVDDTELIGVDSLYVYVLEDPANTAPVAYDSAETTDAITPITFDLDFSDEIYITDPHTFEITAQPNYGAVSQVDGVATYTPDGSFVGDVMFTWTVSDQEYTSNEATVTITVTEASTADPSLISYFNFDEENIVEDSITSCTNCSVQGATWTSSGVLGGAYQYDGINDTVNLGTYSHLDGKNSFTMSLWVNPAFSNTSTAQKYVMNNYTQIGVEYLAPINDWRFLVRINGSTKFVDTSNAQWDANTWHLLTVTYDGTNLRSYFDGVLSGTRAASGTVTTSSMSTHIGGYIGQPVYFEGAIDELKIYDRVLTSQEILEEYQTI